MNTADNDSNAEQDYYFPPIKDASDEYYYQEEEDKIPSNDITRVDTSISGRSFTSKTEAPRTTHVRISRKSSNDYDLPDESDGEGPTSPATPRQIRNDIKEGQTRRRKLKCTKKCLITSIIGAGIVVALGILGIVIYITFKDKGNVIQLLPVVDAAMYLSFYILTVSKINLSDY